MEPLGQKLRQARLARKLTLEEVSRVTKIRPSRIQEIEDEDFSSFASLAYAKGFLLIYGKFLDVDVTPYLDAFETSDRMTVDGYSYLQDSGTAAPPPIIRRESRRRPGFLPFLIAVFVLVFGLYLIKLFLNIQRITPPPGPEKAPIATASATPMPSLTPSPTSAPVEIAAPRAIAVTATPASEAEVSPVVAPPTATPVATEPEVRRAEPVTANDLGATSNAPMPNKAAPNDTALVGNRIQITPVRKTFVTVTINGADHPTFSGWIEPSTPPLTYQAQQVTIKTLDRGAVTVTKNGAPLAPGDKGVTLE
ncbi:MAG TPA: helix-turn-helix domain-containing protein [Chthoniobacterales bacterium]|nr:helix-turn-helix domain-containing protein [Chthoniobacterales bacterium]